MSGGRGGRAQTLKIVVQTQASPSATPPIGTMAVASEQLKARSKF